MYNTLCCDGKYSIFIYFSRLWHLRWSDSVKMCLRRLLMDFFGLEVMRLRLPNVVVRTKGGKLTDYLGKHAETPEYFL